MASHQASRPVVKTGGRTCFVTIGATAGFDSLIRAVLDERFVRALEGYGYKHLMIQYGKDEKGIYRSFADSIHICSRPDDGLTISGFGFNRDGLGQEMKAAKGGKDGSEGVVISHAGKGQTMSGSLERSLINMVFK